MGVGHRASLQLSACAQWFSVDIASFPPLNFEILPYLLQVLVVGRSAEASMANAPTADLVTFTLSLGKNSCEEEEYRSKCLGNKFRICRSTDNRAMEEYMEFSECVIFTVLLQYVPTFYWHHMKLTIFRILSSPQDTLMRTPNRIVLNLAGETVDCNTSNKCTSIVATTTRCIHEIRLHGGRLPANNSEFGHCGALVRNVPHEDTTLTPDLNTVHRVTRSNDFPRRIGQDRTPLQIQPYHITSASRE